MITKFSRFIFLFAMLISFGIFAQQEDRDLVQAVKSKKRIHFVQAANMEVVELLPDDLRGKTHQKWIVRLSSGDEVVAIYNTDMCERVPLRVGDKVSLAGEFIYDRGESLIHWLHHDPSERRPDGYVKLNGTYYCKQ